MNPGTRLILLSPAFNPHQPPRSSDPLLSLSGDANGAVIDFTQRVITIKTAGVTASYAPDAILTSNQNTPHFITDANGAEAWVPHNLYLNSETPATQNVSTTVGAQYTVSMTGTGSIALTQAGVSAGTVTAANPVTYTATNGTLVSTVSGSPTSMQLNRGSAPTAHLATTSSARVGVPISKNPVTGEMMLYVEPSRTNSLINSETPATQTTASLTTGTYCLWVTGSGSATSSAGTATITGAGAATAGSPNVFAVTVAGTVTVTVSGTLTFFQLEKGAGPTSRILTYAAAANRSFPVIALAISSIPDPGSEWLAYLDSYTTTLADETYLLSIDNNTGTANYLRAKVMAASAQVKLNTASVSQFDVTTPVAPTANARYEFTAKVKASETIFAVQGAPAGTVGVSSPSVFAPTRVIFANWSNSANAYPVYIRRFAIMPKAGMNSMDVAPYVHQYTQDTGEYDIFLLAGQSNVYTSDLGGLDPAIDVSGGRTFQLNQVGTKLAADEPLFHPIPLASNIGHGVAFARDYYAQNIPARRKVLLLPVGVGNTGFSDNRWNPGNDLFNVACSMVGVALAQFPRGRLRGIIWMQGEHEALIPWTQAQYETAFDAMIAAFRVQFGQVPVIVGSMRPGWVTANAVAAPVQAALAATPSRISLACFADASASPAIGTTGAGVHYSAAEHRSFAARHWTAWQTLQL